MSKIESKLLCSQRCPFGKDCAAGYSYGNCKKIIDNGMEGVVKKPLGEKVIGADAISAVMTDQSGQVIVSNGKIMIEIV